MQNVNGNWPEVVCNTVRNGGYPVVLMYQRLESNNDNSGDSFRIDDQELDQMIGELLEKNEHLEHDIRE